MIRAVVLPLCGLVGVAVVCWLVGTQTDFGRDVDGDFYAALAQAIPVLLLAFLLHLQATRDRIAELAELTQGLVARIDAADAKSAGLNAELRTKLQEFEQLARRAREKAVRAGDREMLAELDERATELKGRVAAGSSAGPRPSSAEAMAYYDRQRNLFIALMVTALGAAVLGETAALDALAFDHSTTFVFLMTAVGTAILLLCLAGWELLQVIARLNLGSDASSP